jgi:hypothetical protein
MELTVVISMDIWPQAEPRLVPVFLKNGIVIGHVKTVRPTYKLDGQTYTEVVVEVRDDVVQSAIRVHMETHQPVFRIFFPRSEDELQAVMNFGNRPPH